MSGRVPFSKRPAGGQLLARLKRGDHVVMLDVARGFRSFRDAIATLEDWIEGGITVHKSSQISMPSTKPAAPGPIPLPDPVVPATVLDEVTNG